MFTAPGGFYGDQKIFFEEVPYKSPSSWPIVTVTISYIGSVHSPMLPITELVVVMDHGTSAKQ